MSVTQAAHHAEDVLSVDVVCPAARDREAGLARCSTATEVTDEAIMSRVVGRVSSPRFVGRRDELVVLEDALARTRDGWARWCSLVGRRVPGRAG
jgi:hypothetical protein